MAHQLSDSLAIEHGENDSIRIFSLHDDRQQLLCHMSSSEIVELLVYYTDGFCPVCQREMPQPDVICNDCYRAATERRAA